MATGNDTDQRPRRTRRGPIRRTWARLKRAVLGTPVHQWDTGEYLGRVGGLLGRPASSFEPW